MRCCVKDIEKDSQRRVACSRFRRIRAVSVFEDGRTEGGRGKKEKAVRSAPEYDDDVEGEGCIPTEEFD